MTGQRVVFVLAPVQGTAEGVPQETRNAIGYVREDLHATLLEQGSGIWVFTWAPKARHSLSGPSLDDRRHPSCSCLKGRAPPGRYQRC